ncbi:MarR family winged helix-turn-helix transcriptional regulator [Roseibium aggregatum]|uniref:Winged helix-turn-helix transcriptional regulator n=1 Tax=Roseibium aggregatum TaxID=187304 RepID=A0A939J4X8_9HYPH|nr:MarR family winged helix-turn-helix transcriptional regulator [Roseibium aggregatum]MBN9672087.1 winged helix-turn-helix transcriptional regulator [Roseibium aggregatum]
MKKTKGHPLVEPSGSGGKIALGPLETFIGFHLRIAQDVSFQTYAHHVGESRVKPGRFGALLLIGQNPGLTQMELSRALARDKSSVTPLVQALQQQGLIIRKSCDVDRRRVTLWLTDAGEEELGSLLTHAEEHDRKLDAIVGDKKEEFLALLRKIVNELA